MKLAFRISRRVTTVIVLVVIVFGGGMAAILINQAARAFKPFEALTVPNTLSVSGNGGNAVAVGPYLFFIGNYVDASTLVNRQNEHNRVEYGAIYRIRLDAKSGRPIYDNTWLEDWKKNYELYGSTDPDHLETIYQGQGFNTKLAGEFRPIVPKVAGFDRSSMWIFGNHLIYTSPHNRMNRVGQLEYSLTDFFRVDLDGRNHTHLFTSSSKDLTRDDFTVAWVLNRSHLLVRDGNRLVRIGVSHNPGQVTVISERATSFAFPKVTSYFEGVENLRGFGGIMNFVFYTENRGDEDNPGQIRGNMLKSFHIGNGTRQTRAERSETLYRVMGLSSGALTLEQGELPLGQPNPSGNDAPQPANPSLFVVERINLDPAATLFQLQDFVARNISHAGQQVFFPTAETSSSRYLQLLGGNLFTYVRANEYLDNQGQRQWYRPSNDGVTQIAFGAKHNAIASDVSEIISVTPNYIHYLTAEGVVRVIDWRGRQSTDSADVPAGHTLVDRVNEINLSVFVSFGAQGERLADREMLFYMRTIVASSLEEGESEHASITVPVIVDRNGKEWILAKLSDKFR